MAKLHFSDNEQESKKQLNVFRLSRELDEHKALILSHKEIIHNISIKNDKNKIESKKKLRICLLFAICSAVLNIILVFNNYR